MIGKLRMTIGAAVCLLSIAVTNTGRADEPAPYSVVNGKVDEHTYSGWQTFRHAGCGTCHGGAGQGGACPSLVERLKLISRDQFKTSVTHGKNLMPPWESNKMVMDNLDNLYAYLKARSDGVLGEGKLEKP